MNKEIQSNPENFVEAETEPLDMTKYIWIAILLLIAAMSVYFYMGRQSRPMLTMVRASHILVAYDSSDPVDRGRAYEKISELRQRLLAGESFSKLARANSDDSVSARRGGDLGWAPPGTFTAAFEEYCWKGEIGDVSEIIQTEHGFHLIKVVERNYTDADLYEQEIQQKAMESANSNE